MDPIEIIKRIALGLPLSDPRRGYVPQDSAVNIGDKTPLDLLFARQQGPQHFMQSLPSSGTVRDDAAYIMPWDPVKMKGIDKLWQEPNPYAADTYLPREWDMRRPMQGPPAPRQQLTSQELMRLWADANLRDAY